MTYYDILEISEKASQEVIRMAYKALCKKYHPDVYVGDKKEAEEKIKKINEAFSVLSDELKKKEYDNSLKNENRNNNNNHSEDRQRYGATNIDALIKRGFMALEDEDWNKADIFFEQALNQDAEIAEAHLGKLMVELKVKTKDELKNCSSPFDDKSSFQRAFRFANDTLKTFLSNTIQFINRRNYEAYCYRIYFDACRYLDEAPNDVWNLEEAISLFKKIPNYKDSSIKIQECEEKIKTIKENIEKEYLIRTQKTKKTIKLASVIIIPAILVFVITIILVSAITKSNVYNQGLTLIDEGEYVKAIAVLETIEDYKDSYELVQKTRYLYAKKLFEENNFEQARDEFSKTNFDDSSEYITLCTEKIDESNYQKALSLIKENEILKAYDLLEELSAKNYKDSKFLIVKYNASYENALFKHNLKTADIGSVVTFGSYEQDDNLENGKEPVKWIIIDRNEKSTMLISKDIIEYQPYLDVDYDSYIQSTWETCTLRKWLNSTFYNSLFNTEEKKSIVNTTVIPDPKEFSTSADPGGETIDKIYLLSGNEYNKYKTISGVSECELSRHVFAKIRYNIEFWWLRSPSDDFLTYAQVVQNGNISTNRTSYEEGIRPVVWVDFS